MGGEPDLLSGRLIACARDMAQDSVFSSIFSEKWDSDTLPSGETGTGPSGPDGLGGHFPHSVLISAVC